MHVTIIILSKIPKGIISQSIDSIINSQLLMANTVHDLSCSVACAMHGTILNDQAIDMAIGTC